MCTHVRACVRACNIHAPEAKVAPPVCAALWKGWMGTDEHHEEARVVRYL